LNKTLEFFCPCSDACIIYGSVNDSTDVIGLLYIRITMYVLSILMHMSCALAEEKFLSLWRDSQSNCWSEQLSL